VVILHSGDDSLALLVDGLEGEQEIVIKSFSPPLPKPLGIAGASILGDGRILAIADVMELVDLGLGRLQRPSGDRPVATVQPVPETPLVLVVDDSVTVREMLTLTLKRHGYRVEQAGTGADALARLRAGLPCQLVLCDVEMPTMGGLELLERLRDEGRLATLPVALLTSRSSERHRQIAHQMGAWAYFTKPFLEEPLMEALKRLLAGQRLPILLESGEVSP
jgi:chemosensory pili system protein ChpA (sensor histidine kinase/response regulator)